MDNDNEDGDAFPEKAQIRVAVIGTGLAGLTTSYLLHHDCRRRYAVEVFEKGNVPSLAAASMLSHDEDGKDAETVDIPMRAFTGGYYRELIAMYDYLKIRYHEQRLRFVFSESTRRDEEAGHEYRNYFSMSSDARGVPLVKPSGMPIIACCLEFLYVLLCVCWLTITFSIISAPFEDETFEAYLHRFKAPSRFRDCYLLPLLSSIATCSHQELLNFPASDVVEYRKAVRSQKQYLVTGGVKNVQETLLAGMTLHTQTRVLHVETRGAKVHVVAEAGRKDEKQGSVMREFDQVILAVSPNVAAELFEPARNQLSKVPVRVVDTVAERLKPGEGLSTSDTDEILLRTSRGWTESVHLHHSGASVTSCPQSPTPEMPHLLNARFTRALRTLESRRVVQEAFDQSSALLSDTARNPQLWRNGDGGVWMVGAWCWDGMVLLEGAVVSAMRVAQALDVDIPWAKNQIREACNGQASAKEYSSSSI